MGCVAKLLERFKGLALLSNEFRLREVAKIKARGGSIRKIFQIAAL